MRNLLSANFFRLRRSALLWGLLAFNAGFGVLVTLNYYDMNRLAGDFPLDGAFFLYPVPASVLTAVFIPLFFGREYGDHAIRNKVAVGCSRPVIYVTNLLTAMAVTILFCAGYMVVVAVAGTALVGFMVMELESAVLIVLGSLAALAALCALFTVIVMVCGRKSLSAMSCVLGIFLLLIASIYIRSRLLAPECITYSFNAAGNLVQVPPRVNPEYLGGIQRAAFSFLNETLPSSQLVRYVSWEVPSSWEILCSLSVIALSTGAGIFLFRKKDLK